MVFSNVFVFFMFGSGVYFFFVDVIELVVDEVERMFYEVGISERFY